MSQVLAYQDGQLAIVWSDAGLFIYLSARLEESTVTEPAPATAKPIEFTPCELEVLHALVEGRSNKSIAALLGKSEHTVKFHVNSLTRKVGCDNRVSVVTYAFRNGLVS